LLATAACTTVRPGCTASAITAGIALVFKAIVIPIALPHYHPASEHPARHRDRDQRWPTTLIVGVALVGLSIWLVLPVTTSSGALTGKPDHPRAFCRPGSLPDDDLPAQLR